MLKKTRLARNRAVIHVLFVHLTHRAGAYVTRRRKIVICSFHLHARLLSTSSRTN
jgi:hypothetical protein